MAENHYLVPIQLNGLEKNIAQGILTQTQDDADDFFVNAKERLMDINNWNRYSSLKDIEFILTDKHGHLVKRSARRGDHIKIKLQSETIPTTDLCSWTTINAIEYDDYPDVNLETFAMRLCPEGEFSSDNNTSDAVTSCSTITIVIERVHKKLYITYHGRNEHEQLENSLPDYATQLCRTVYSLSDLQCANLVKGWLQ